MSSAGRAGHPSSCYLGEASGAPERGPGSALADRRALVPEKEQADGAGGGEGRGREGQEEEKSRSKKKNYHRYAKPPYSYLAMIALVIQSSPEKKLKLSQILKEISSFFPFFKGDYQGWKDSIRHNLSSNDCFQKVLKDPGKPQSKGNFWMVDVTRIPPEALKLQNTSIARQSNALFAFDLAPYILHGLKYPCEDARGWQPEAQGATASSKPQGATAYQGSSGARPPNSFMIDALLDNLQGMRLPGKSKTPESRGRAEGPLGNKFGEQCLPPHLAPPRSAPSRALPVPWGPPCCPLLSPSAPADALPCPSWRPSCGLGYSAGASVDLTSSSSVSTSASSDDERDFRSQRRQAEAPKRPSKLPRLDSERGSSSSDSDDPGDLTPVEPPRRVPATPWELPTSYTKFVPPNMVAPPSLNPFLPFASLPCYGCGPTAFLGPACWGLVPGPAMAGQQSLRPPLLMDLDSMLQVTPPNKSVFDVWSSHPGDLLHPVFFTPHLPPPTLTLSGPL
ncbi:forkhead box protein H1-like isoform X2 [Rhinatrema bivittatum]|nr:forkhead box protein H1-like isoform X2 [Rhinatrema bivittatum]